MAGDSQSIVIDTSPEVLYGVITDYTKYPEFLDNVEAVVVHSSADGVTEMTQTLNLVKKVDIRLRLTETPYTAVSWTLISAKRVTKNDGGWVLEDLGNGRTKATYSLEVALSCFVPRRLVDMASRTTLPATLNAFKARAESLA